MATKIITAATALLLGLSTVAFAGTPKTDAKTDAKTPAKVEAKTATTTAAKSSTQLDDFYWFDANNGTYINHGDESVTGCSGTGDACANGYNASQVNLSVTPPQVKGTEIDDPAVTKMGTRPDDL